MVFRKSGFSRELALREELAAKAALTKNKGGQPANRLTLPYSKMGFNTRYRGEFALLVLVGLSGMQSLQTMEDARSVAARVLAGEIQPNLGCNMIAAVAENLDRPRELMGFELLAHEQSGHEHLGITAESCIPDILEACRELLASQAFELRI